MLSIIIGGGSDAVEKKAKDPKMTLHDNPMAGERPCPVCMRNMRRMREDAELRENPLNGHVYEAFKSVRYGQEK